MSNEPSLMQANEVIGFGWMPVDSILARPTLTALLYWAALVK